MKVSDITLHAYGHMIFLILKAKNTEIRKIQACNSTCKRTLQKTQCQMEQIYQVKSDRYTGPDRRESEE